MSENVAAVETMNADDAISKQTKLYGLIAENASTNRLFVIINRLIKADNTNAMIIPMNIREDDFYFTVSNMKKSHVSGAYIDHEYQEEVLALLDAKDEIVDVYQRADFVVREGETLSGYLVEKNDITTQEALAQAIYEQFIKDK